MGSTAAFAVLPLLSQGCLWAACTLPSSQANSNINRRDYLARARSDGFTGRAAVNEAARRRQQALTSAASSASSVASQRTALSRASSGLARMSATSTQLGRTRSFAGGPAASTSGRSRGSQAIPRSLSSARTKHIAYALAGCCPGVTSTRLLPPDVSPGAASGRYLSATGVVRQTLTIVPGSTMLWGATPYNKHGMCYWKSDTSTPTHGIYHPLGHHYSTWIDAAGFNGGAYEWVGGVDPRSQFGADHQTTHAHFLGGETFYEVAVPYDGLCTVYGGGCDDYPRVFGRRGRTLATTEGYGDNSGHMRAFSASGNTLATIQGLRPNIQMGATPSAKTTYHIPVVDTQKAWYQISRQDDGDTQNSNYEEMVNGSFAASVWRGGQGCLAVHNTGSVNVTVTIETTLNYAVKVDVDSGFITMAAMLPEFNFNPVKEEVGGHMGVGNSRKNAMLDGLDKTMSQSVGSLTPQEKQVVRTLASNAGLAVQNAPGPRPQHDTNNPSWPSKVLHEVAAIGTGAVGSAVANVAGSAMKGGSVMGAIKGAARGLGETALTVAEGALAAGEEALPFLALL